MDTVIGEKGGKVLLTIHFVESSLMLSFIRDANTSQSVIDIIEGLYKILGDKTFKQLFPIILTDNRSEFSNPKELEFGKSLTRRTNVFYCDPSCPFQKGAIEVNHELIRRILPKGTSFDNLVQKDIFLMMKRSAFTMKNRYFKAGNLITKMECRLQNGTFGLQKGKSLFNSPKIHKYLALY